LAGARRKARWPIFSLLVDATRLWLDKDAFRQSAALAFFTLFSIAPVMIILVAIVGAVYGLDAARGEIAGAISAYVGADAAMAIQDAVQRSQPEQAGIVPMVIGISAMLFGATTVFAQMQGSLNHFWSVRARPVRSGILRLLLVRLLSLGMVLIIGFLMLMSFAMSIAIAAILQYAAHWVPVPPVVAATLDLLLTLCVTTAVFAMLFKVLPDVVLGWSDVLRGAAVTCVLFVSGQYLISYYLTRVAPASAYGAAGSLVLVLFWVYYSSLILFFGAGLTRAIIERQGGKIVPRRNAVRVKRVVEED